ncbi:hypothetical protein [Gelria sp. Kuro-4]|uniref:hypothetical protein n=1 Tax=Gelria sp. Kuro-4 TaxID=2796927 RepID=UPI001BF17A38|nr:hypothetical protein [Gelria sp. Kuro-4]BCV23591.1 hypothetical protein kuro4_03640 [Gelria sp. Kuro-4]
MTHTLHRQGTAENLAHDYCVLAIAARGINSTGSGPKLQAIKEIFRRHNPVNLGDIKRGNMYNPGLDAVLTATQDGTVVHAVFTTQEDLVAVLRELKDADTGMSIVVSGLFDHVGACCQKAGLTRHTVEYSLGVHGAVERLPERSLLEVTTMCGHGMVSFNLVRRMVREIEAGRRTAEDAAQELARQCICGVFNPARAAELLTRLVDEGFGNARLNSCGSGLPT